MTCLVSEGDLPLEITWHFEGDTLDELEGISITSIGKRGSLLLIEPVSEAQSGNFTCTARNKAGVVDYTASLSVYGTIIHYLFLCIVMGLVFAASVAALQ